MAALPNSMKALVKETACESYLYKDVPVPQPGPEELLVKVSKVALCGTDIQKYKWNDGKAMIMKCCIRFDVFSGESSG